MEGGGRREVRTPPDDAMAVHCRGVGALIPPIDGEVGPDPVVQRVEGHQGIVGGDVARNLCRGGKDRGEHGQQQTDEGNSWGGRLLGIGDAEGGFGAR